ncbi:hypothetical protein CS063_17140 [Sporanaerobium hydrogeniformans]|uniref:Uncharacterized protein n=1 Tax=Sporanaerobium hydrogeniformans TaxID=3072179 RepID=A0AC61D8N0_9FIRM|nr:hypothetical protein [Sporanaerobium hydrogeniformans]PHV69200.1 hypothetical protein CS063_17140 [Sporanaerobium hydrogeniformans]
MKLRNVMALILAMGMTTNIFASVRDNIIIMGYEYTPIQEFEERMDNSIFEPVKQEEYIPFDTFTKNNDTYILVSELMCIDDNFKVTEKWSELGVCISYKQEGLEIQFTTGGETCYILQDYKSSPSNYKPILKEGKIYVPFKLIKEKIGYDVVIPKPPVVEKVEVNRPDALEQLVPVKGTTLGFVRINKKLCQMRYIQYQLDNLVNLSDYARYIPCLWSYDEKTNVLEVKRGKYHWAEFKPGELYYNLNGSTRMLDFPVERIGNDFYIAMHLLARIKSDIYAYTLDGKYISIETRDFTLKQRDAERRAYIEKYGEEAWQREERNRTFLGEKELDLGYSFTDWRDTLIMMPHNPDGTIASFSYVQPLPLDVSKEALTRTGKKLKMGPFTVPLYKGTISYNSHPAYTKDEFISEIRHPFGLGILCHKLMGKEFIELSIAKNADIELVIKELYTIFAPQFTAKQVEQLCNEAFEKRALISNQLSKEIEKKNYSIASYLNYRVNSRGEKCFERFEVSYKWD